MSFARDSLSAVVIVSVFLMPAAAAAELATCSQEKDPSTGRFRHESNTCGDGNGRCVIHEGNLICQINPATAEERSIAESYGVQSMPQGTPSTGLLAPQMQQPVPVLDFSLTTSPNAYLENAYPNASTIQILQTLHNLPGGGDELSQSLHISPLGGAGAYTSDVSHLRVDLQGIAPQGTVVDVFNAAPTYNVSGFVTSADTLTGSAVDQLFSYTWDAVGNGFNSALEAAGSFASRLTDLVADPANWFVLAPDSGVPTGPTALSAGTSGGVLSPQNLLGNVSVVPTPLVLGPMAPSLPTLIVQLNEAEIFLRSYLASL